MEKTEKMEKTGRMEKMVSMARTEPVSYTHLDVYKRQVLEVCGREVRSVVLGAIDLHRMNDPYEKLRYIFERVGALVDEYRPVSYTHLDVYKRQALYSIL